MPRTTLKVGPMDVDMGASPGTHLWMAKDTTLQKGGYEKLPEFATVTTQSVGASHRPRGVYAWRGSYTGRMYLATDVKIWEVTDAAFTDVTGNTPDNATYGATFTGYGEWCFMANGVDEIQVLKVPSATGSTNNFEDMAYTTGGAKIAPKYICAHKNHIVAANIKFLESYGEIATSTTGVGSAFSNQPTNDFIELISDSGSDTNSVAVYGTTNGGGDTVTVEVLTMTGLAAKKSTTSNWDKILGWNLQSTTAVGTITLRKFTGGATISTIAPLGSASGIYNVPAADQAGGDRVIDIVASAATTKQVGVVGTTPGGTVFYDSQALSGTTTVQSNSEFRTVTNFLIGDIENTVTVTFSSHQYPAGYIDPYLVWWSGTDDPEGYGTEVLRPQITGSGNQPMLDGYGEVTGVVDGGDCFFVFKQGCVFRFDGPPFQPTMIEASKGMASRNIPYRQGNRVYFWSDSGLHYIDISSNQVVNTMANSVQRSVIDTSTDGFGGMEGLIPVSNVSTLQMANVKCTGSIVSISGDPYNSCVWVMYLNGTGTDANYHGLIYHESVEVFTSFTGPSGSNALGTKLVMFRTDSGSETGGIGSCIKCFYVSASGTITYAGLSRVGFSSSVTRDMYLRWPFWSGDADSPKSRITRVRPLFDNSANWITGNTITPKVEVLSISGTGKTWTKQAVYSTGLSTTALDGWITVNGCPLADSHSIGISILGTKAANRPGPYIVNFVGIEVEYVLGSSRAI